MQAERRRHKITSEFKLFKTEYLEHWTNIKIPHHVNLLDSFEQLQQ